MIDIISGIILICYIVKGVNRGLIRSVYHILNVLIAAFCSFAVYPVVGLTLSRTPVREFFSNIGFERFVKPIDTNVAVENYIENFDKIYVRGASTLNTTEEAGRVIAYNVGNLVCNSIAYILVFIALIYVVNYGLNRVKVLNKVRVLPLPVRSIGGGCFGALRGIVILSVAYAVLEVVVPIFNNNFLNWFIQSRLDGIFVFKDVIIDVLSRITYYN
ncbi:MAG: CvpA family protein [Clostridia bacterium]|nr:CvpA family protein [Clostridia bacterium]